MLPITPAALIISLVIFSVDVRVVDIDIAIDIDIDLAAMPIATSP